MSKTIGILTGGGDVPGLNPAMKAFIAVALNSGYKVYGVRRGSTKIGRASCRERV